MHHSPQACSHHSAAVASSESGDSSSGGGMAMTFQSGYAGTPILLTSLEPRNNGEFVAAVVVVFLLAMLFRCIVLLRTHLEARYWGCSKDEGAQEFSFLRDVGRALLTAITATVGYAVMLITMTFVVGYFFAVVGGLAVAEFLFARLVGGSGGVGGCSG